MIDEPAHDVLWRRMTYSLTPQWDLYMSLRSMFAREKVLEVGFGTGAGVLQYYPDVLVVDALETDQGAVSFAERMFPLPGINWIHADITEWEGQKRYHAAVMIETLEHIADWERALHNIYQHLLPGGRLIMSARNTNTDLRRAKEQHMREWSAVDLYDNLKPFFSDVHLYDYTLENRVNFDTTITPLFAIAYRSVNDL